MHHSTATLLAQQHRTEKRREGSGASPVAYVAGPMTGIPFFNFPLFERTTRALREGGWFVYSPHEEDIERGEEPREDGVPPHDLSHYMAHDLPLVCKSDALILLPGWENSRGAKLEWNVACALDIPAYLAENGGKLVVMGNDADGDIVVSVSFDHLSEDWTQEPGDDFWSRPAKDWSPEQVKSADEWWNNLGPKSVGEALAKHQYPATVEEAEAALEALRPMPDSKATNPKDLVGSSKMPLHLWPTTASVYGSLGLLEGMLKYGRSNWRAAGVRYSIYHDAVTRHLNAAFEGEWLDPDSGLPHLSHALACLAIIVDAHEAGMLTDDRAFNGAGYRECIDRLTPEVERLKAKYHDRDPKHWTIEDGRHA